MSTERRRARRQPTKLWRVPVIRTRRITPRMARITVGGPQIDDFAGAGTDENVMLYLYEPGAELPEPLTLESARVAMSRVRPYMRTYTIRRHDPVANEIDFDFVLHGDHGPASKWASNAQPGDEVIFVGPSPAYQPDPDADWHLLIGDETALPAISSIMEALPGARIRAFVEIENAAEEQDVDVTWVHRDGVPAGSSEPLVKALTAAEFPDGTPAVWAAGERQVMQAVREVLAEKGIDRASVRPATYWRLGHTGS
ncbi:siderophore-interacting protein [Kibdelosporangium persicum]|uniref:NADPH-dependent ferric siderophore reductase n=1 Tax=Kibdelosporangium persicum TaxID=2698649 RepID=A0ABX2FEU7_9PSEU|nr:siderophore-interacting protein [Kibdelosporangium persicum]NRN69738.1 NADPH-dependent ferric siderophore reductase [Kibdelosporangium persicum]